VNFQKNQDEIMNKISRKIAPQKLAIKHSVPSSVPMTAEDYEKAARADSTLKAYANDIRYFGRDACPLPSSPTDVIEWLVKASTTLAPATIQRRLVALSVWHKQRGFTSPVADSKVKRVFAGICRTLGTKQRSVKPLVRDDLISVLASVERQNPIAAARDSALLLLAFASALRRSNLVTIKVEELTRHPQGLDIFIPRSKTDPGKGRVLSVPNALGGHCPVKALTYWLTISGIQSGYVFRSVNKHGQVGVDKLEVGSVGRILKRAVALSGRDATEYSSHSGRAGFVTSAAMAGMPTFQIAQVTDHKGIQSLQRYMRVIDQRRIASLL
jgi:integrase